MSFFLNSALAKLAADKRFETNYQTLMGVCIGLLRKSKKMSQTNLANKAGISQTTISRIELGEADVTTSQLDAIASALGCSGSFIVASVERIRQMVVDLDVEKREKVSNKLIIDRIASLSIVENELEQLIETNKASIITHIASSVLLGDNFWKLLNSDENKEKDDDEDKGSSK